MPTTNTDEADSLLFPPEVAEILRVSVLTLTKWRYQKKGPPYYKPAGSIRYRQSDVDAWIESTRSGVA